MIVDSKAGPAQQDPAPAASSSHTVDSGPSDRPPAYSPSSSPQHTYPAMGSRPIAPAPQPLNLPDAATETSPLLRNNGDVESGQRGRRGNKFSKRVRHFAHFGLSALGVVLLVLLLTGFFRSHEMSHPGGSDERVTKPDPSKGYVGKPIDRPSWDPIQRDPRLSEEYSQTTRLSLPADQTALFIHNFGNRHSGSINLVPDHSANNVEVIVEARATSEWILRDALTVAKMQDGSRLGVGIYTDDHQFEDNRHRLRVLVTVKLPGSSPVLRKYSDFEVLSDTSSLRTEDLGTMLEFANFKADVRVGSVHFKDTFRAKSTLNVSSRAGSITSNGLIDTDVLDIRGDVGSLHFDTIHASTSASLVTKSGTITYSSLISPRVLLASKTGSIRGENANAHTFNATTSAGSINVGLSPVPSKTNAEDAADVFLQSGTGSVFAQYKAASSSRNGNGLANVVHAQARSSVGSVTVKHWPGFVGSFDAKTKTGSLVVRMDDKDDKRELDIHRNDGMLNKHADGCVFPRSASGPQFCDSRISSSIAESSVGSVQIFL